MKISVKKFYEEIFLGIGLLIIGFFIAIILDITILRLIGIISIIFGISFISDGIKYSQNEKTFEIKEGKIIFNYKEYPLDKLNLKILHYKTYKKVSLFYDRNFKPIFENVLFSEDEFKEFLKIINPYLKEKINYKDEVIQIFDNGFSIYGSFFTFDEIKYIKLNYGKKRVGDYIEIILFLKDKNLSFVIEKEYEKAMALKLKINNKCDYKDYSFIYVFLILGFILTISRDIYLIFLGFLILIVGVFIELKFNDAFLKRLCEKVKNEKF